MVPIHIDSRCERGCSAMDPLDGKYGRVRLEVYRIDIPTREFYTAEPSSPIRCFAELRCPYCGGSEKTALLVGGEERSRYDYLRYCAGEEIR